MTSMTTRFLAGTLLLAVVAVVPAATQTPQARQGPGLPAFTSDTELSSYLQRLSDEWSRRQAARNNCPGATRLSQRRPRPDTARAVVIRGRVTAESGSPVAGANLVLVGRTLTAVSSNAGEFRLVLPASGSDSARRVVLRAVAIGYAPASREFRVRAGDSVDVVFTLCAQVNALEQIIVTGVEAQSGVAGFAARAAITNTQHAGVDEGGIVKMHGDHLVVLRRGRLFTVRIGDRDLSPVAAVDAFGPDIDPRHAWYDELIVSGDQVVVIGYSYERGGTELGLFRIDPDGGLRHRGTYHLRSNDYYSSRNYASRLIGDRLVFYTPLYLRLGADAPLSALPAMRRWTGRGGESGFERIVTPQRIYRPSDWTPSHPYGMAFHTVTSCDLATDELTCEATVVLGPASRVFYVSPTAVYVWMSEWHSTRASGPAAMVVRMPLDGSSPSALGVAGSPVDQFSFLEDGDGYLTVLVRSDGRGEAMWRSERTAGAIALLRAPLRRFGDGGTHAQWWWYRSLPDAPGGYAFHNRFVGEHLLYGSGSGWGAQQRDSSTVVVVRLRDARATPVPLPHGADRIEVMGSDAVVVGTGGSDLHFSGIRLTGRPEVVQRFVLPDASQGELRSHGFFYRADDADAGVLGLPVHGSGRRGWEHLIRGSASILYLRNDGRRFTTLGALSAAAHGETNDRCRASCVDWYGNARPIFLDQRVFALLGYELVEGAIRPEGVEEVRRVSFAPQLARAVSR